MITVNQARTLLAQHPIESGTEEIPVENALGRILAADICSPVAVPHFDNSAMDGYAFAWSDYESGMPLVVIGESAAGDAGILNLKSGTSMRIFTGAMLPDGADTVVMQEKVQLTNGHLKILDEALRKGSNVRKRGSQNEAGQLVLQKGHKITPGTSGFLASLGINRIPVRALPAVSVVVTGNEITAPGSQLSPGQVFECNSFSLVPALGQLGIIPSVYHVRDDRDELYRILKLALDSSDLILVTGGVSVGDYDYVVPGLNSLGVQTVFHRIAQKPAKPLFFGIAGDKRIFGLPGNPASVLTSWYVYISSYISSFKHEMLLPLSGSLKKKQGLTLFAKGKINNGKVQVLEGQESYRMDSFAQADCLIELPEETEGAQNGDQVKIIPFGWV